MRSRLAQKVQNLGYELRKTKDDFELVRLAALRVYQGFDADGVPEGPIRLRRAEGPGADDWMSAVAEIT